MLGIASAYPANAQDSATPAGNPKDWTLNLKDVDIQAFLQQVSSITGENFIVDPAVKGKVTVIATTPMDAGQVDQLAQSVLRANGLAAVQSGNVTRIVPQDATKPGGGMLGSKGMITRVVPVRYASVDDAVKVLKPLASPTGDVEGSPSSNTIVIADYADNVAQMMKTLARVDTASTSGQEVVPLREARAETLLPVLKGSIASDTNDKTHARPQVVADAASNSIIVQGEPRDRAQLRALIDSLDHKAAGGSDIQLIRLQYADAKDLAPLLRGMLFPSQNGGAAAQASSAAQSAIGFGASIEAAAAAPGSTLGSPASSTPGLTGAPVSSPGTAPAHAETADLVSPDIAQDLVNAGPGGGFIQADLALNALIVRAPPAIMDEVKSLVKQLDVQRPQVLIEAAIVEITTEQSQALGVQLAGGDAARSIHAGTTQFSANGVPLGALLSQIGAGTATAAISDGLSVAIGNNGGFTALVQALANTSGVNLLSAPSITTLDNEPAQIVVGQNVPFRTGSFSTLNSGVADPFTTIERQDIGITLKVVPQIYEGNQVRLTIAQEVSSIANNGIADGAADLITNKRTIDTKVLAQDGQTIVLGGLMEDDSSNNVSKVPVLGDIPVLGYLFGSRAKDATKRNLVVFLRPTVIRGHDKMAEITQGRFQRMSNLRNLNNDQVKDIQPNLIQPQPQTYRPGGVSQAMPDASYENSLFNPQLPGTAR